LARPQKTGLEYKPQFHTFENAKSRGGKHLKRYLRNSSSAYIKKKAVREFVLKRDNYTCTLCGSKSNLQIDHIIPVYQATIENIYEINCVNNLRTICNSCNARRVPNG